MLIVALVLAVIGLAALVTAVVTSNEIVAWVCIAASALGVVLLVVDAFRERQSRRVRTAGSAAAPAGAAEPTEVIEGAEPTEVIEGAEPTEVIEGAEPTEVIEGAEPTEAEAEAADAETDAEIAAEDHPDEVVHDEPEFDTYSDDEPEYPEAAEEAAIHTVDESEQSAEEP